MVSSHNSTNWPKMNSIQIPCTPPFMLRRKESSTMMSNSQWLVEDRTHSTLCKFPVLYQQSGWAPQQSIPTPGGPPGLCLALLACCFCYCFSSTITAMAPASALVFPSASVPHLAKPEWFSGASGKCRAFLVQCGLHFELQASSFPIKQAKGAFMITQLSGRSEAWVTTEWARNYSVCHSLTLFSGWTGGWTWTGHHCPSLEASTQVTHCSQPFQLIIHGNHTEHLTI